MLESKNKTKRGMLFEIQNVAGNFNIRCLIDIFVSSDNEWSFVSGLGCLGHDSNNFSKLFIGVDSNFYVTR